MRRHTPRALIMLTAAALTLAAQPPRPRVQTEYMKSAKKTRVESNVLYVVNAPDQFLQLQLRGWFKGQQLAAPAEQIEIGFYSYGLAPKYEPGPLRQLTATADGQTLALGQLSHVVMVAEKKGAEGLPQFARLRETVGEQKLKMELLHVDVSAAQFARLAKAERAELGFGATRFALNEVHLGIIREFAAHTIPAGWTPGADAAAPAAPEAVSADTPSEANNAPLEETLKWLKKELSKHGSTTSAGRAQRLEVASFSSCKIRYRVAPVEGPAPPGAAGAMINAPGYRYIPPTHDYSLDLSDLDPRSVVAATSDDATAISFATRDGARKITEKITGNAVSRVELIYGDQHHASAVIVLRKTKTAPDIAAALTHAIKQCQAKP